MLLYLLQGAAIGFSAGMTPGPLLAYFSSCSLRHGWRRTLPAAFAPLLSDIPIIALVLLILTRMPDWFLATVRVAGGVFILWLAARASREARHPGGAAQPAAGAPQTTLRDAVVMNLLNPNPYIFWGASLGPILIAGWRVSPAHGIAFAGAFYGVMIGCYIGWIWLFGNARRLGARAALWINRLAAAAMALFGLYQIFQGIIPP
jgi:threonine/homoserine/homoserine lactone efflux protein